MLAVKGMTLKYPASTALALACAAFRLMGHAKSARTKGRYAEASRKYVEGLGGYGESGEKVRPQCEAVETLRSNPAARDEARAAISRVYSKRVIPRDAWV